MLLLELHVFVLLLVCPHAVTRLPLENVRDFYVGGF
jgi:hypothetical protein